MTKKEKRLKRKKKAEKKKMRKIWYKGNPKKIIEYMKQSSEIFENNWVNPDTQIYKSDKFFRWEIEPIEINDETIEQKRRAIAEFYGMIKSVEERKRKNNGKTQRKFKSKNINNSL